MRRSLSNKRHELKAFLKGLSETYSDRKFLRDDPIYYVHQYKDPADQEIAALISASLAFGNVKAVQASVQKILGLMGASPRAYILSFNPQTEAGRYGDFVHRWVRGGDIVLLMAWLNGVLKKHKSLKALFLKHHHREDKDIKPMLEKVTAGILEDLPPLLHARAASRGFRYFFPSPKDGSPCKRLNMFLRWVVRPKDGFDLGLWPEIPASKLIIPLDTHIFQFALRHKLSAYKNPRWEMAVEVTEFLKELSPEDPVRYDFPICHHGMTVGW
jgi:uncharacterized protein (TIGR02757 family)